MAKTPPPVHDSERLPATIQSTNDRLTGRSFKQVVKDNIVVVVASVVTLVFLGFLAASFVNTNQNASSIPNINLEQPIPAGTENYSYDTNEYFIEFKNPVKKSKAVATLQGTFPGLITIKEVTDTSIQVALSYKLPEAQFVKIVEGLKPKEVTPKPVKQQIVFWQVTSSDLKKILDLETDTDLTGVLQNYTVSRLEPDQVFVMFNQTGLTPTGIDEATRIIGEVFDGTPVNVLTLQQYEDYMALNLDNNNPSDQVKPEKLNPVVE